MSGAIAAMKQRMARTSGGGGPDWFYLAMALWKEGAREQARTWFQKAASWTDQRRPKDDELRRLRAEAAAVLHLSDNPLVTSDAK
jgi:hypothetical protein